MKHIVMTEAIRLDLEEKMIQKMRAQFADTRSGVQSTVTMTYTPTDIELEEPIVIDFSGLAYAKQLTLVQECKSEIAWHGIVRTNAERTVFAIDDILVYPQTVTGATVVTDEVKYESWKAVLDNDTFNKLRFQAHSHVHMGITPSGVDRNLYNNILQCLGNESFYIFMIVNKSNQMHIELYDLKRNAIYSGTDIVVSVEGEELDSWYIDVYEKNILTKTYAPINPTYTPPYTPKTGVTHGQPASLDAYREYYEDQDYDPYATYSRATPAANAAALKSAQSQIAGYDKMTPRAKKALEKARKAAGIK